MNGDLADAAAVPNDAYIDTSMMVAAIFAGSHNSVSARVHADRPVTARSRIYFSQVLRLEVTQALQRLATSPTRLPDFVRTRFDLDRWESDFMTRHRWMTHGVRQFDDLLRSFSGVYEIPITLDIWQRSVSIISHYRLRSIDAVHVATAQTLGIRDFYTGDAAFRRIDGLNVILVRDND